MQTAYTKPLSLWQLVEQHANPHEQDELKDMLGRSVVEQSLELHKEIDMLLEIWREVRDEVIESSKSQPSLPEPPNQRERLVQEICFFVENVKEQAKSKGIDPDHILKRHNSEILDYAVDKSRPESARSRSSRLSDGRETPMTVLSPDRIDLAYTMTDQVETINRKINYMEFGDVCDSLKSYLEKEVEQLLEDVQFLQTCLDEAADTRDCPTPSLSSREPTLTELREERTFLEKELFATEKISATPVVHKALFSTSNRVLPKTPPTPKDRRSPGSPPQAFSTRTKTNKSQSKSNGPLRARHDLSSPDDDNYSRDKQTMKIVANNLADESKSNESIGFNEEMFSPLSIDSSPSLDAEFFGISPESSGGDDSSDEETNVEDHHLYGLENLHQGKIDTKPLHHKGLSMSGLSTEKGRPSMILPSPATVQKQAVPSRSDSNLGQASHTTPHPPSQRPGVVGSKHARRRTVSPRPHVRVVDMTNLVGAAHGDSPEIARHSASVIAFTTSSSSSSLTSPISSSPSSAVSSLINTPSSDNGNISSSVYRKETPIRPKSANRFREMVLGCRDGQ